MEAQQGLLTSGIEEFISSQTWIFAKTMKKWPHWYALRKNCPWDLRPYYRELARLIFEEGYDIHAFGRTFRYYDVGPYKYWSCDPTIDKTDLINRAFINRKVEPHEMRNILPGEFL
jgi:hypothetical protein